FVWKQNYILVDEYFFFCCTWIVNSAINKKPGAKCLPGFRFIRQIAVLTANLLHRLQNTLI
ncbi:hypothetical protein CI737_04445, partial [Escherichia coli]